MCHAYVYCWKLSVQNEHSRKLKYCWCIKERADFAHEKIHNESWLAYVELKSEKTLLCVRNMNRRGIRKRLLDYLTRNREKDCFWVTMKRVRNNYWIVILSRYLRCSFFRNNLLWFRRERRFVFWEHELFHQGSFQILVLSRRVQDEFVTSSIFNSFLKNQPEPHLI